MIYIVIYNYVHQRDENTILLNCGPDFRDLVSGIGHVLIVLYQCPEILDLKLDLACKLKGNVVFM